MLSIINEEQCELCGLELHQQRPRSCPPITLGRDNWSLTNTSDGDNILSVDYYCGEDFALKLSSSSLLADRSEEPRGYSENSATGGLERRLPQLLSNETENECCGYETEVPNAVIRISLSSKRKLNKSTDSAPPSLFAGGILARLGETSGQTDLPLSLDMLKISQPNPSDPSDILLEIDVSKFIEAWFANLNTNASNDVYVGSDLKSERGPLAQLPTWRDASKAPSDASIPDCSPLANSIDSLPAESFTETEFEEDDLHPTVLSPTERNLPSICSAQRGAPDIIVKREELQTVDNDSGERCCDWFNAAEFKFPYVSVLPEQILHSAHLVTVRTRVPVPVQQLPLVEFVCDVAFRYRPVGQPISFRSSPPTTEHQKAARNSSHWWRFLLPQWMPMLRRRDPKPANEHASPRRRLLNTLNRVFRRETTQNNDKQSPHPPSSPLLTSGYDTTVPSSELSSVSSCHHLSNGALLENPLRLLTEYGPPDHNSDVPNAVIESHTPSNKATESTIQAPDPQIHLPMTQNSESADMDVIVMECYTSPGLRPTTDRDNLRQTASVAADRLTNVKEVSVIVVSSHAEPEAPICVDDEIVEEYCAYFASWDDTSKAAAVPDARGRLPRHLLTSEAGPQLTDSQSAPRAASCEREIGIEPPHLCFTSPAKRLHYQEQSTSLGITSITNLATNGVYKRRSHHDAVADASMTPWKPANASDSMKTPILGFANSGEQLRNRSDQLTTGLPQLKEAATSIHIAASDHKRIRTCKAHKSAVTQTNLIQKNRKNPGNNKRGIPMVCTPIPPPQHAVGRVVIGSAIRKRWRQMNRCSVTHTVTVTSPFSSSSSSCSSSSIRPHVQPRHSRARSSGSISNAEKNRPVAIRLLGLPPGYLQRQSDIVGTHTARMSHQCKACLRVDGDASARYAHQSTPGRLLVASKRQGKACATRLLKGRRSLFKEAQ